MKSAFAAAALAAVLCVGGAQAQDMRRVSGATLRPDGLGPVRIDMTVAEAQRALGRGWELLAPLEEGDPNGCRMLTPGGGEGSVQFMVENMRIVRAEIVPNDGMVPPTAGSERGIHIGSTEADVRRAYGRSLVAEPHNYLGLPARYLTVWTVRPRRGEDFDHGARGVRFVTDEHRRVTEMFGGDTAIRYIEGCA